MINTPITINFKDVSGELEALNTDIADKLASGGEIEANLLCEWHDRHKQLQREMTKLRNHFYICGLQLYRASEGVQHGTNS